MTYRAPDPSPTERLSGAIHDWATGPAGHDLCQERDAHQHHWPCWHLGAVLARVVDEAKWRTVPSEHYNEGLKRGFLEMIRQIDRINPDSDQLYRWRRRIEADQPDWWKETRDDR